MRYFVVFSLAVVSGLLINRWSKRIISGRNQQRTHYPGRELFLLAYSGEKNVVAL